MNPREEAQIEPMLACDWLIARSGKLEISAECHYHSGLTQRLAICRATETAEKPSDYAHENRSYCRDTGLRKPLKNQVITHMKIVAIAATLLLAVALFAQPAHAEGDAMAGKELAYTCLGCHGIEGYRNAYPSYRVPKLGGQKAGYLEIALQGYRAYLASIGDDTVVAGGTEGASFDKAAACAACHGQNGISVNAAWPTLAGQHEDYLLNALHQYRDGTRGR
jgi:cytochrome c553